MYHFSAKKGQKASIEVNSNDGVVRFSFFELACIKEPAFSEINWSGALSCCGRHEIVVVMNDVKLSQGRFKEFRTVAANTFENGDADMNEVGCFISNRRYSFSRKILGYFLHLGFRGIYSFKDVF